MLQTLKKSLPDYAKDIKLNLNALLEIGELEGLTQNQIMGIALASVYSTKQQKLIKVLKSFVENDEAAKAAG